MSNHRTRLRSMLAAGGVLVAAYGGVLATPAQAQPLAPGLQVELSDGILIITGGVGRDAMIMGQTADRLLTLNDRQVLVDGAAVRLGDLQLIRLDGGPGDDTLRLGQSADAPRGELRGGDGNDQLVGSASDDLLDGGQGIDAIDGSGGADEIIGGDGNDKIIGGQGDDLVRAGLGSDQFTWLPGSGNDVVDGGQGTDTLVLEGSDSRELLTFAAAVHHVILSREAEGTDRLVLSGFEYANADLKGGQDTAVVNDLPGSGLRVIQLTYADGADPRQDKAIFAGTAHADRLRVFGSPVLGSPAGPAVLSLTGSTPTLHINGAEGLTLLGQGGNDVLDASRLPAGLVALVASGGLDDDTVIGTPGLDRLFGDDGDDRIEGHGGDDVIDGGTGTNVIIP